MKVATRLHLAVLPSLCGIVLVAALAYWGQYAHQVPETFVIVAAVAAVATLALSWANVRYVAARVERLSRRGENASRTVAQVPVVATALASDSDELGDLEVVVDKLRDAVENAERVRARDATRYREDTFTYASMLASLSQLSRQRMDEIRLPLHILLENHFGDLNENQEEMLVTARIAADRIDDEFVALQQLAELDLGIRQLRRDRVYPADLLNALLPLLEANAAKKGRVLHLSMAPLVPAIRADVAALQQALTTLLGGAIQMLEPETVEPGVGRSVTPLELALADDARGVQIRLHGGGAVEHSIRNILAKRLLEESGAEVTLSDGELELIFRAA